jgi:DNA-binding NarL/FixJ family response regulator
MDGGKRVLLVDDFHLCRTLFAEGLRQSPGLEVFEAATGEEALSQTGQIGPDVIVLNVSLRHRSGLSLLRQIRRQFPDVGLLAFSYLHHDHLYADRAICAGASGYISVDEPGENLLRAVESIMEGKVYLSPALRKKLSAASGLRVREKESALERLSHREYEVFCLTGHGHMPKRIAGLLKVNVKTIGTYRERIREKLGLTDGSELLYHATCFVREQRLPLPEVLQAGEPS